MAVTRRCLPVLLMVTIAAWTSHATAATEAPGARSGSAIAQAPAGTSASPASNSDSADDDLQASAAPAWVPPRPVSASEPPEYFLRLPVRIVALPLSALGWAAEHTAGFVEERQIVPRFAGALDGIFIPHVGLSVGAPHLGPGVGLGLAARLHPSAFGEMFFAELSGSTRKYSRALIALHRGPATVHYENDWRPRDPFFGFGPSSSDDSVSSYAWRQQRYQLTLAYPPLGSGRSEVKLGVSAWVGPREITIRHGKLDRSFEQVFPSLTGLLDSRQEHFVYGMRIARDLRGGVPHWNGGYVVEARAERFDKAIDALTIRSANTVAPQFTRISVGGQTAASFSRRNPRTLRATARAVMTESVRGSASMLMPDLASLGADDGLASLDLGRFRDRDLLYGALMYIIPLSSPLELEFHAESGGVFPKLKEARLSLFRESYGFSLRPRTPTRLLAAIGADWSPGAFSIRYKLGGVE
jgi:hypothetical protein